MRISAERVLVTDAAVDMRIIAPAEVSFGTIKKPLHVKALGVLIGHVWQSDTTADMPVGRRVSRHDAGWDDEAQIKLCKGQMSDRAVKLLLSA